MNERQKNLILLGELHMAWVSDNEDVWKPSDARPGLKGTDYPLHAVDRSADAETEKKFADSVANLFR